MLSDASRHTATRTAPSPENGPAHPFQHSTSLIEIIPEGINVEEESRLYEELCDVSAYYYVLWNPLVISLPCRAQFLTRPQTWNIILSCPAHEYKEASHAAVPRPSSRTIRT